MAKIKGADDFQRQIAALKYAANEMRGRLEKYQTWYADKPDWYKYGKHGQNWVRHLFEVQQQIEAIERIEFVGRRFNIRNGTIVLLNENEES